MTTTILFIVGVLLCAWATLRCVGNECERRIRTLEEQVRSEREAAAATAAAIAVAPKILTAGGSPAASPAAPAKPAAPATTVGKPAKKEAGKH